MMTSDGVESFVAAANLLDGQCGASDFACPEGLPTERLRRALLKNAPPTSPLDLAVLVRHVLRAEDERRGSRDATIRLRSNCFPVLAEPAIWSNVGLQITDATDDGIWLRAEPWRPTWLVGSEVQPVDATVCAASVRRTFHGAAGDPFLSLFDFVDYRSVGQRAGVRAALLTPASDTLVIDLPTSDGKSLVFRAIDRLGYASDPEERQGRGGVTLVIVPTVALAIDHARNCQNPGDGRPLAYVGGAQNREQNDAIRQQIRNGTQGLCFAAPEAAVGPLRKALIEAARLGALRALVIDEAHLVDAWGTGFRTEFQQLAGLRLELLEAGPPRTRPRTLLLSATLSASSHDTLKDLFGTSGRFAVLSAPQVRPEPEFWIAPSCTADERRARVREAILRVPRPAIVYVTKVDDAYAWKDQARTLGLCRCEAMTGETPTDNRRRILEAWSQGDLDLVVATSAFGLGIDYPFVRSVIHACVPESLDRFYQEVGRAGRDGRASLSLLAPAHSDIEIARRLADRVTISIERGLRRWTAMFEHRDTIQISPGRFRLRLDVPPGYAEDDIDKLSGRNTDWHARTLVLMARAGLIRFSGASVDLPQRGTADANLSMEDTGPGPPPTFETVEIVDTAHLDMTTWQSRVQPVRDMIYRAGQDNLARLRALMDGDRCPADLLADLYGGAQVDRACGGCGVCRADPAKRHITDPRREPSVPWDSGPPLASGFASPSEHDRPLLVYYDPADNSRRMARVLREVLSGLVRFGLRRIAVIGNAGSSTDKAIAELAGRPVFVGRGHDFVACRLPLGPHLLILGDLATLRPMALKSRRPGDERIILFRRDLPSPQRPDLLLQDVYDGPAMSLDDLHARIGL